MKIIKIILIIIGIALCDSAFAQSQNPCSGGDDNPNGDSGAEGIGEGAAGHGEFGQDASEDPNEIVGIDGWLFVANGDTVRWISASQRLSYTIYFENDPIQATASAQVVTVRLPLDPLMSLQDFAIGTFGFSNRVFPVDGNSPVYQTRLDLVQEMNLYVDVVAGIDITTNEAFWIFSSIDPATGVAPTETDRGFLPVNDSTHIGEGFVTFTIKPKTDLCHTGDSIVAQATIVFDINDPIETNRWVNRIDAGTPVSSATVIFDTLLRPSDTFPNLGEEPDSIRVVFSGTDDTTGIAAYRLYYTEGRSAFRLAGRYLPGDTAVLENLPNTQYTFFSLAEDNVGNIEPMKDNPDTLFGNSNVQLLANVTPPNAATVTGAGTYPQGDTASITLHPTTGYRLTRWTEAGIPQGTDSLLTLVADANHILTAEMERLSYPLTVEAAEGTTIDVTSAGTPVHQTIQHFDTLNIHLASSPCYSNIAYQLNGLPLLSDTILVVTEAITLTSTATTQIDTGYVYDTICPGHPYTANGFNILSTATHNSGTFTFYLSHFTSSGCDSVARLSLYVKPKHTITFLANGGDGNMTNQQVCDGEETILNNATFTREGYFFAGWAATADANTAQYADGGIITINTNLSLYAVWSSSCVDRLANRMVTVCDNYSWRGQQYTASGTYNDTITGVVPGGCDSIYRLHLTMKHSSTNMMEIVACQPYTWVDGQTYASDTTRMLSMTNGVGCDSIITLNLTMNDAIHVNETQVTCDSLTWRNGITYYQSTNTPVLTTDGEYGCDSIVTLHLSVNYSNSAIEAVTACNSYIWHGTTYTASTNTPSFTESNVVGCDSVVTLNLTINNSNTGVETKTACNSYVWHGTEYTASTNTPTFTTINAVGCDSVTTLHLTIVECSTNEITSCDSYTWHGISYNQSGLYTDGTDTLILTINYSNTGVETVIACDSYSWIDGNTYTISNSNAQQTLTNVVGCDSVVTLNLTVNYSNTSIETVTACDTYTWHGTNYTANTNSPTFTETNAVGCDSVVTLNLTINYSNTGIETVTACDSHTWHGTTYTAGGTPTYQTINAVGCDSTVTLNLTINYSSIGTDVQTACDSYTWHGTTYTVSTNTPTFTEQNAAGCDSVVTLSLTIRYSSTSDTTAVACDSYTWHGTTYTAGGASTYQTTNAVGCDSVVTLNLTVNQSNTGDTTATACDSFTWWNTNYTNSTNEATHVYINNAGCDSVVTLNLTINYSSTVTDVQTACDSYTWHGTTYTVSTNTPTFTEQNAAGCDSVVTLNLTVRYSSTGDTSAVACDSFTWWNTNYTNSTNEATHTLTNSVGCDSVVTLNLTVNQSNTGDTTATACDSFTWWNTNYTNSTNEATHVYINNAGCDSVVTLNLTINYSNSGVETQNACDIYTWHGTTYTTSINTPTFTEQNTAGCDSVVTLNLTIRYSSTSDTTAVACDSYTWHGTTYTAGGAPIYQTTNAVGCDSVVTLNLTVNYSSSVTDVQTACDSYTWIDGMTYTSSTITGEAPTYQSTNVAGCDSIVTLNLTINYSNSGVETQNACDSYTWHGTTYTVSTNTPTFTEQNAAGCDSVVTLNLTINYSVMVYDSLTLANSELPYDYHGNTVDGAGDFTFDGTTAAGCDSTTLLHVEVLEGIDVNDPLAGLIVYPNPTQGTLIVDADDVLKVEVYDLSGRRVASFEKTNTFDISALAAGSYTLRIETTRGNTVRRIVKK